MLTPDKELNILIYAFLCHYMKKLYTFKNGPVFWPTLYTFLRAVLGVTQSNGPVYKWYEFICLYFTTSCNWPS